jgi:hypothetical protein
VPLTRDQEIILKIIEDSCGAYSLPDLLCAAQQQGVASDAESKSAVQLLISLQRIRISPDQKIEVVGHALVAQRAATVA